MNANKGKYKQWFVNGSHTGHKAAVRNGPYAWFMGNCLARFFTVTQKCTHSLAKVLICVYSRSFAEDILNLFICQQMACYACKTEIHRGSFQDGL
jgi:hypothetical protein